MQHLSSSSLTCYSVGLLFSFQGLLRSESVLLITCCVAPNCKQPQRITGRSRVRTMLHSLLHRYICFVEAKNMQWRPQHTHSCAGGGSLRPRAGVWRTDWVKPLVVLHIRHTR